VRGVAVCASVKDCVRLGLGLDVLRVRVSFRHNPLCKDCTNDVFREERMMQEMKNLEA